MLSGTRGQAVSLLVIARSRGSDVGAAQHCAAFSSVSVLADTLLRTALAVCAFCLPGVHHPSWEGAGLCSILTQGAVFVHKGAAAGQDVHDSGGPCL